VAVVRGVETRQSSHIDVLAFSASNSSYLFAKLEEDSLSNRKDGLAEVVLRKPVGRRR